MTNSINTMILEQALFKLESEYRTVFQTSIGQPDPTPDTRTHPFQWVALGKSILEDTDPPEPFDNPIARFDSSIDSRFTAMMWRVMPIVWSILPHSIKSAHASDERGEPVEGPAVEMAKAILGDDLAPLVGALTP